VQVYFDLATVHLFSLIKCYETATCVRLLQEPSAESRNEEGINLAEILSDVDSYVSAAVSKTLMIEETIY
jgi:hypothetical protein